MCRLCVPVCIYACVRESRESIMYMRWFVCVCVVRSVSSPRGSFPSFHLFSFFEPAVEYRLSKCDR